MTTASGPSSPGLTTGPAGPDAPDEPVGTGPGAGGGPPRRSHRLLALAVGVAIAAVLAAVLFSGAGSGSGSRQVAPGIDTASAQLLDLNVFGAKGAPAAPPVDLVDERGAPTTLSQFRGKVVVWSLNDDQCTDLCMLYAQDVRAADRDLGRAARDVVFMAVNANPYYPSPASLRAWSATNHLTSLANWVYVTGTPTQLQDTWDAWHVSVLLDPSTRTVDHSFTMEFVDPQGRLRAVGDFGSGAISVAYYGHAMAQMAEDLLPASERTAVGGPALADATGTDPTVGGRAPAFSLPRLGAPGQASLAGERGKPLVLSFWSSTCTACRAEMPALEQIHQQFGRQVTILGVDVADPSSRADAYARHLGVTYPLAADHSGAVAAAYDVGALPVTFVIGPHGTVEGVHQGALTDAQLSAVLQLDFQSLMPSGS